jgi:hypothetical protein
VNPPNHDPLDPDPQAYARALRKFEFLRLGWRALDFLTRGALIFWGAWSIVRDRSEGLRFAIRWDWGQVLPSLGISALNFAAAAVVFRAEGALCGPTADGARSELRVFGEWAVRTFREWVMLAGALELTQVVRTADLNWRTANAILLFVVLGQGLRRAFSWIFPQSE